MFDCVMWSCTSVENSRKTNHDNWAVIYITVTVRMCFHWEETWQLEGVISDFISDSIEEPFYWLTKEPFTEQFVK